METNENEKKQIAVIIGGGPAGLTAAFELATKTKIKPIIFEVSDIVGGISQTRDFKGNKMDIGGHRFFSKSDKVMEWWKNIMPIQETKDLLRDRIDLPNDDNKETLLERNRISRIYYNKKFFDYPIKLSLETLQSLGILKSVKIVLSYVFSRLFPMKDESNLENFYINRFGTELYKTFFKEYTAKLWGRSPSEISSEWGAQRVKGVSLVKAVIEAIKSTLRKESSIEQKNVETSLIQKFLYPKRGPGQLWNIVGRKIEENGGEIHKSSKVVEIHYDKNKVSRIVVEDQITKERKNIEADYFFSTMPIDELVKSIKPGVPENVKEVAEGLIYRDFITVGILAKDMEIKNKTNIPTVKDMIPDTWVYIQDPGFLVCRVQFFNNWSPFLVENRENAWIGMEYVVNKNDEIWEKSDEEIIEFGIDEAEKIGLIKKENVIDANVIKMTHVYPCYFGTYNRFDEMKSYLNKFENLFLIGRNGMFKYNNQDHSMLTAITAVENLISGKKSKDNIWDVNTEKEYHEEKGSK